MTDSRGRPERADDAAGDETGDRTGDRGDIRCYPPGRDPSGGKSAISDNGYRISSEVPEQGEDGDGIDGYRRSTSAPDDEHAARRPEILISQAEFMEGMPLFQDSGFESIEGYLGYERLLELADRNGVAPATMARILVVRAVRADAEMAAADD